MSDPGALASLQELLDNNNAVDIYRKLHPNDRLVTWYNPRKTIGCRLDRFYVSSDIAAKTSQANIHHFPYSDHDCVVLHFQSPCASKRGPGYWKLNTSVLAKPTFFPQVHKLWEKWQQRKSDFPNLNVWWDKGKLKLKDLCQKFSKQQANMNLQNQKLLEKELKELLNKPKSGDISQKIGKIQEELGAIHNKLVTGAKIRSKEKFYHDDEKPTKYFFNLENNRQNQKRINELIDERGVRHTKPEDVMKHIADFYEDLYTFKPTETKAQETLLNTISRRLPEEVRVGLEGPLTVEECYQAMSNMECRKSLGSDGLPVEFYLLFWEIIGEDFVEVLNHSYEVSTLPLSMRQAMITLAHKKGDKDRLSNWRSISLLNVDYKIGSKSLANRLQPSLEHVLHSDQTCNVPG